MSLEGFKTYAKHIPKAMLKEIISIDKKDNSNEIIDMCSVWLKKYYKPKFRKNGQITNDGRRQFRIIFGYSKVDDGEWEINKKQSEAVKLIFQWFIEGNFYHQICKLLEKRNILTCSGKKRWNEKTIQGILKRLEYSGKTRNLKGEIIEGKIYKRIIDFETWEKAKAKLKKQYIK